ncbi:hypothetical protein NH26_16495 [Flammeovirga pacifica]|uniref:Uncharacterized protein n=1 Tax=Flammeovirga pacifica TaxID=915059 RepID=A0A1S1Z3J8_FLAPC|nr:hypothetical protein NH26_16495 [Flammeovirga pacifica]
MIIKIALFIIGGIKDIYLINEDRKNMGEVIFFVVLRLIKYHYKKRLSSFPESLDAFNYLLSS